MDTVGKYLAVAVGGALGAIARYAINNSFLVGWFQPFPFPTFFINVTGSLLIGFVFALFTQKMVVGEYWQIFLTVGFLGAYTTFSTFEFETLMLIREKKLSFAMLYVLLSVIVGFAAVLAGVWLANKI